MAVVTITINGNDYEAYASVANADIYLAVDSTRATPWGIKNTNEKGALLVAATRRLDLLKYIGDPTAGPTQNTEWPRTGAAYQDGTAIADTDIPVEVSEACMLLAGTGASDPKALEQGTSGSNIKNTKAGSAEVTFFRPHDGVVLSDETSYAVLRNSGLLESSTASASTGALASGTDERSSFSDDPFGLNRGYS